MYRVLVIADRDLDGTGSAVIITKFFEMCYSSKIPFVRGCKVDVMFPSRKELDDLFSNVDWCYRQLSSYNEIFLCDTCPNSLGACENIGTILSDKMTVFDHHETNLKRLQPYEANFTDAAGWCGLNIIEGDRCSAKLAFDILRENRAVGHRRQFNVLLKFAGLVNDLDMWYRQFPRSTELADYVAAVGPEKAYPVLLQIASEPDKNVGDMKVVLSEVEEEKQRSLALAKATLVKHKGYKTPFYTCVVDDWASWVAGEVCPKTGLLAMFDLSHKNLGFRVGPKYIGTEWHRANEPKPDCLDFAEMLGGGGHPQAAGAGGDDLSPIFKQLSEKLGETLLETYNGNRSTKQRNVRRANSRSRKPRAKRS